MYKMYLISAEVYENEKVHFLTIKTTSDIWVSRKDVGSGMGVKNISDLVLKEIYGICETKNPTKKQVNEYKMTKREIYKKFTNLSQEKLNTINNKKTYVKNDIMTTIIKGCRGEKKRGIRAIDGFRNKLMIPDFEIPKCPEFAVKSKIRKIPLKNILLRFMKLILVFMNIMKKKYKLIKMDVNIYYLELIFILVSVF